MKLISSSEMREIDYQAINHYGIPSIVLMENAGIRTVEVIDEILQNHRGRNVVVLAGKGNNGGDGLVIARHLLNSGMSVDTFVLGFPDAMTADAYTNYRILENLKASIHTLTREEDLDKLMLALLSGDLVVDAMYGNGFKGSLGDFEARVVKMVNWSNLPVVAVDIPSGVEADTGRIHGEAVKATHTVTFALPKVGLVVEPGRDYVGTLSVADISIPSQLLTDNKLKTNLIDEAMIKSFIQPRLAESHKGTYGHALVIGGSLGLTGAVKMSSYAALRAGAGLVTAALPESLIASAAAGMAEVMTAPLAETSNGTIALEALPAIENLLGTISVCAIGPGMSGYPDANAILRFVLQRAGVPLVIDADGLNALMGDTEVLKDRQVPVVLTPHPGEMSRLTGRSIEEIQSNRIETAREFATKWGVTLVLKGNKTVIADPAGNIYININGNPGMATAGSGDVLCGMITGFIAQGLKPQDAALVGVFLHGMAGDLAAQARGQRGLIATDMIGVLPEILARFEQI